MNIIRFFIILIGILCVLLIILIEIKIGFEGARGDKCTNRKNKKIYNDRRYLWEKVKKIITYILVVDLALSVIYIGVFSVINMNRIGTDLTEKTEVEVVTIDPKSSLAQDNEEKIESLFEKDLYFSWYEYRGENPEEYYRMKVDEMLEGKEPMYDVAGKVLEGDQKAAYDSYVDQIEEIDKEKVPDEPQNATLEQVRRGEIRQEELSSYLYVEEYGLWKKRYLLWPTADNLQQTGRSALDVQTTMIKHPEYEDNWDEIIEYAVYGIQSYLALIFYISSDESKADCCYWIAKTYYDLAQKMPDEFDGYDEHCYWMAYTFAQKGVSYISIDDQKDDHSLDLVKIRDNADIALRR